MPTSLLISAEIFCPNTDSPYGKCFTWHLQTTRPISHVTCNNLYINGHSCYCIIIALLAWSSTKQMHFCADFSIAFCVKKIYSFFRALWIPNVKTIWLHGAWIYSLVYHLQIEPVQTAEKPLHSSLIFTAIVKMRLAFSPKIGGSSGIFHSDFSWCKKGSGIISFAQLIIYTSSCQKKWIKCVVMAWRKRCRFRKSWR